MIIFAWIVFCFVAGAVGADRRIGFWGAFFISLILSPLIGLILAFASRRKLDEIVSKDGVYLTDQSEREKYADLKRAYGAGVITRKQFEEKERAIFQETQGRQRATQEGQRSRFDLEDYRKS